MTDKQRLVALFGESLFMDAVESGLDDILELGVVRIHTTVTNVGERLASLSPDLIILDLNAPDLQFVLSYIQAKPGIPLLCLDMTSSRVIALSSEQHAVTTAKDLAWLVRRELFAASGELDDYDVALDLLLSQGA